MQKSRFAASVFVAVMVSLTSGCDTAPVTGRSQFIVLSDDQAQAMGAEAYDQILAKARISKDAGAQARVARIGRRIAAVSHEPDLDWEYTVIEDKTPNAFALPGGKVGVNTGMFDIARTDDQLAAVIAHEIAHATARHSAERISQQLLVQGGLQGLGIATGSGSAVQLAAAAAQFGVILPFSRSQELEADAIGLMYMAEAGYDPRAAVDLWNNMAEAGGKRPVEFLSTHPAPESRIKRLQDMMPEALAAYRKREG